MYALIDISNQMLEDSAFDHAGPVGQGLPPGNGVSLYDKSRRCAVSRQRLRIRRPWRNEPGLTKRSRMERLLAWLTPGWIKMPFRSTK
jgi:hypothetical protein